MEGRRGEGGADFFVSLLKVMGLCQLWFTQIYSRVFSLSLSLGFNAPVRSENLWQVYTLLEFVTILPVVETSVLRVRFLSKTSVHSTARFVLHYNTAEPGEHGSQTCLGLSYPDQQSASNWHHVAANVEQVNSSSSRFRLYVNGNLVQSAVLSTPFNSLTVAGMAGIAIGRGDPSRAPPLLGPFSPSDGTYGTAQDIHQGAETFWAGGLDELRVWNTSRNAEQILSGMYQTCKQGGDFGKGAWPVLCYAFDELVTVGRERFLDLGQGDRSDAQAVVGDKYDSWCTTLDDSGVLMSQVVKLHIMSHHSIDI